MEKRLLLAAVLSLAVLAAWEFLVPKPPKPAPRPVPPPAATAPVATAGSSTPAASEVAATASAAPARNLPAPVSGRAEEKPVVENALVRATFSNKGAVLSSLVLLQHTDDHKKPLELVRQSPGSSGKPLAVEFPGNPELTRRVADAFYAVEKPSERSVRFSYADDAVAVTKEIRFETGYLFDVKVSVVGPRYTLVAAEGLRNPSEEEVASRYVAPASAVVASPAGLVHERADKLEKPMEWPIPERGFAGIEDNYFLAVLIPKPGPGAIAYAIPNKDKEGKPAPIIAAGLSGQGDISARGYYGPKDVEILESLNLGLERTVDFGWYGILARPLLWLLKRTYTLVHNWGAAILIVTLLIRILLFPLMHKSYSSMKKMQKLAPKMNAIRDKYKKAKSDAAQRQKMNEELMKLYQAEGYNPMSGCFPILLQLPILVAFYNVLSRAIELRHAPFVLWITDLSAVDRTYVLLILMTVTMYIQQAMTPTTADPAQKKIFMAMPLIWGFFLKDMPSGLVLYWLFSNVLTILQQALIQKMGKDEPEEQKPAKLKRVRA
ncbi:MAG TPA: membrane protein insertase YidC [Thermoanaerobaculia bacterium]|nr:membrane protein insertase YidC [Thermoanaerobaculia bacterium]